MIDRRGVCVGVGLSLVGTGTRAAPATALFSSGPLAMNSLAASYQTPSEPLGLPDIKLVGEHGTQILSQLRGRTYLVSLWAEWCSACLAEAGDMATLGKAFGGPNFEMIFVLTGSHKKLGLADARSLLAKYRAGSVTLLVEPDGHDAVMQALATTELDQVTRAALKQDRGASLPCNLLIDRQGRVRGRSFGSSSVTKTDQDGKLLYKGSSWATPAGHEFIAALAAGVLNAT